MPASEPSPDTRPPADRYDADLTDDEQQALRARALGLDPIPRRGPALIYIDDGEPATVTRLDHAVEENFAWMDSRTLRIMQALIDEAQSRINTFREDIGK